MKIKNSKDFISFYFNYNEQLIKHTTLQLRWLLQQMYLFLIISLIINLKIL